jgi:hypothetical protein
MNDKIHGWISMDLSQQLGCEWDGGFESNGMGTELDAIDSLESMAVEFSFSHSLHYF